MSDPVVSVLTAVRNGAAFLAETVESVLAQTFEDWEYLIVDDASDDDTPAIAASFADADPRIRVIRRERSGGPYEAANEGLAHARGRYVARIDADDLAVPERLAWQLRYLEERPDLRACAGYWQVIDDAGTIRPRVRVVPSSPKVIPWFLCVKSGFIHSSAFVDRSYFEEIGGYRVASVSQDYHLWCELSRRRSLGVVPEVVVRWREHASSIGARSYDKQIDHHLVVMREHLIDLTGRGWSGENTDALFQASRARDIGVRAGLDAIDRWAAAWRASDDLAPGDRRELAALTARLRLRHVRYNGVRHPAGLPYGLLRTLPSAVRFSTGLG